MECVARYDFAASRPDELSFKEKDVLKVVIDPEKSQEDDWATAELRGKIGMIPKNYITTPEWFYRGLSRAQAEFILMEGQQPDGAFLIRESESSRGDFSLSVRFGSGVQHFKILVDKASRKVFLWEKKFETINKLVNYFREKSVSRTNSQIVLRDMIKKKNNMDASHGFPAKQPLQQQKQQSPWANQQKAMKPPVELKPRVKAMYDFEPQDDSELELRAGDVVEVLDKSDQNWWLGKLKTKKGLFPSTYVQEIKK